ncbi:hypothetical protein [Cognataquiflexum aquatile]|uniref:hypothetical protein n=1 Tax=Cognataquiflexum aquatile TaxID=2249427 RepID=UPI0018E55FA4|nr:hypothetical protein [Cognataquiflexum aquatile]
MKTRQREADNPTTRSRQLDNAKRITRQREADNNYNQYNNYNHYNKYNTYNKEKTILVVTRILLNNVLPQPNPPSFRTANPLPFYLTGIQGVRFHVIYYPYHSFCRGEWFRQIYPA